MVRIANPQEFTRLVGPGPGVLALGDAVLHGKGNHAHHFAKTRVLVQAQKADELLGLGYESLRRDIPIPDLLGVQAWTGVRELDQLSAGAVEDAVRAVRATRRHDIMVVQRGGIDHATMDLMTDLQWRGASPRFVEWGDIAWDNGKLLYKGREAALPEAVFARGMPAKRLLPFEEAGVHFANRPSTRELTLSKSLQSERLPPHGVSMPATKANLTTLDEVLAAAEEVGYPVMVKKSNGTGSNGVQDALDSQQLIDFVRPGLSQKDPNFLVQPLLDAGSRDRRNIAIRNVHGEPQIRAVVDRVGDLRDPRANGGAYGSIMARRAPDLWVPEDADNTLRAMKASGLDFMGSDAFTDQRGRKGIFEINSSAAWAEDDVPLPFAEHGRPGVADWLVWGRRSSS